MKTTWHQRTFQTAYRLLLGLGVLFAVHWTAFASERTDLGTANKLFQSGFYQQAEEKYAAFSVAYSDSQRLPEVYLNQARCRLNLSNSVGALELLRNKLGQAGDLSDQYQFLIANCVAEQGNLREAAEDWDRLTRLHPDSPLCLLAFYNEAFAFSKLREWDRIIALLGSEEGEFQNAVHRRGNDDSAQNCFLLLAEAYFKQDQYEQAERVLREHPPQGPLARRAQLLLSRIQLATGRPESALATVTNLSAPLPGKLQNAERAENISLLAEIYESLGQITNAIDSYTNNLDLSVPVDYQRTALFKTVELTLKQNKTERALALLADFMEKRPSNDPALDVACLALGEVKLRAAVMPEAQTNGVTGFTNLIQQAITNFTRVIFEFPNSSYRGKAFLDRGWCYWTLGGALNISQARSDFYSATESLSTQLPDLAIAHFKLADTQMLERDYAQALTFYRKVLDDCRRSPSLKEALSYKAMYQILCVQIASNEGDAAGATIKEILDTYPDDVGKLSEGVLLWGKFQTRRQNYAEARETFASLIKKFPNLPVVPEVQFAIARTYAQEGDWASAASQFDSWSTNFAAHPLLPEVEYCRALTFDKAGYDADALQLFTNFVARFPTNHLAPWAQNWVGDYYFNQDSFVNADRSYKQLVTMLQERSYTGVGDLCYQARLMVGRSAFARQEFADAAEQFTAMIADLVKDSNAPPVLLAQTFFALGDTRLKQFQENAASTNAYATDAVIAFSKITNGVYSAAMAPLAMARLGDCNFEWAKQNTNSLVGLTNALNSYQAVLQMPASDASVRSGAQVNLGLVYEQLNRPDKALDQYLDVIFSTDPKQLDPYWCKEAGVRAARLCKARGMWEKAVSVYQRVIEVIPSLRATLEDEIARANAHQDDTAAKK